LEESMAERSSRHLAHRLIWTANVVLALALALWAVPRADAASSVTIAAAGDIACKPQGVYFDGSNPRYCQFRATARAIRSEIAAGTVQKVFALGDTQYSSGTMYQYLNAYDPTWGTFKGSTRPAAGNHEYATPNAAGYFEYFAPTTPQISTGRYYYSYDLGSWHVIVLDSDCKYLRGSPSNPDDGCVVNSPQMNWLERDLANDTATCTLAYWHHPVFSSAESGYNAKTLPFWRALYAAGVDVVVNGHRHVYERFAPQDPNGTLDRQNGIVEFIAGTGGDDHGVLQASRAPNEIVRNNTSFGYLKLTLQASGYAYRFVSVASGSFTDSGTGTCH
jgi:hypothetical protein